VTTAALIMPNGGSLPFGASREEDGTIVIAG
jgi:hypothetical protein